MMRIRHPGEKGREKGGEREGGREGERKDVVFLILWSTVLHITHQCESGRFFDNYELL